MRIDWWTLALQTINVLILIWILARFFFRPVMDIVVKRQQETNKLLNDAADARQKAADACADADKARSEIAAERQRLVAEAQEAARTEKQNLIEASQEIANSIAKRMWRSPASGQRQKGRYRSRQRAIDRDHATPSCALSASGHVLRIPCWICHKVRALSPAAREGLAAAAAKDAPIEIVTAASLSAEETRHVRTVLKDAPAANCRLRS